MTNLDNLMHVRDAAKRLGISEETIRRLVKAGKLSHFRIGKRIAFSEQHLLMFLSSSETQAK